MRPPGRPPGAVPRNGRIQFSASFDKETLDLVELYADGLEDSVRGNKSEVLRRAVWAFSKDGRSRLFAEMQATIDSQTAEVESLRRSLAALDAAQKRLDLTTQRQQEIINPERGATADLPMVTRVVAAQPAEFQFAPSNRCARCGLPVAVSRLDSDGRCRPCQLRVASAEVAG